jgi:hypothetical protein
VPLPPSSVRSVTRFIAPDNAPRIACLLALAAHCHVPGSPYSARGYILRADGDAVTHGDGKQRIRARERGALTGNGVTTRHPVTRFFGRPVPFRFSRTTGPSGPALASFGPKRTSIGSLVRQTRRGDGRVPGNVALNGLSILGPCFGHKRIGKFSSSKLAMIGLGASMNPTTDVNQAREALISRVDEQLAHVNEQIRSADEQLARLSSRKREAPRYPPGLPRGRPWLRGIMGLLIAAYIVAAAFVSQSSYGNAVAESAPLLTSALALPLETLGLLTRPNPSSVQLAATAGRQRRLRLRRMMARTSRSRYLPNRRN